MKKIFTFFYLFLISNLLYASNWIGGVGNWGEPANWNPAGVPTVLDDVTIYSGEVTIDENAFAKSVVFQGTSLVVNNGVTLKIENAPYYGLRCNGGDVTNNGTIIINTSVRNGILNQGSGDLTNNGTITINGTTSFYHAIDNRVGFTNLATGVINIDNTENGSGISNYLGSQIFWNEGEINIAQTDDIGYYGIDNRAEFYNNGDIVIGSASGNIGRGGVYNEADCVNFTNDAGTLTINNTGTNFSGIDNRNIFNNDNSSEITFGTSVYRGIDNIGGTFKNISGLITINILTDSPILNRNSGSFINSSLIDIEGNTTSNKAAIDNRASFTNSGSIDIDDSQGQGILIFDSSSSFTNSGTINIGANAEISTNGIENNGATTNSGTINIGSVNYSIGFRGIYISSTGTFDNDGGSINIDNTTVQALQNNGGTFDNKNVAEINIGLNAHCAHRGIDNNGTFDNRDGSGIYINDVQYEAIYTSGGTFSNYGTYVQHPTTFWAIRGADGSSFINKSTGEIYSGKAIDASYFTQEGIINPGNSPGTLQIDNGFAPTSTAEYICEISGNGGANAGDQDQIRSTQSDGTSLDGKLTLEFGSFTPAADDEFIVLEFVGTLSGTFSTVSNLPTNWVIDYGQKLPGKVVIYGPQSEIPIKLLSFDVEIIDDEMILAWKTASEINNDYFDIEYSENGINFNSVGRVEANGNSKDIKSYSYKHSSYSTGTKYYRLKQVDFGGKFEYSDVVSVVVRNKGLNIYPNPATDYIIVENVKNWDNVIICDMKGEKQFLPKISGNKLDVSKLSKGIYNIIEKGKKALRFLVN